VRLARLLPVAQKFISKSGVLFTSHHAFFFSFPEEQSINEPPPPRGRCMDQNVQRLVSLVRPWFIYARMAETHSVVNLDHICTFDQVEIDYYNNINSKWTTSRYSIFKQMPSHRPYRLHMTIFVLASSRVLYKIYKGQHDMENIFMMCLVGWQVGWICHGRDDQVVQAGYDDHLVIVVRLPTIKFMPTYLRIKVDNYIYFILHM
jgi:hypothetical protein